MTSEDDFQAQLDANPDDWQTRLVFADWLDERGDPRAGGYRALGFHRWRPYRVADEASVRGGYRLLDEYPHMAGWGVRAEETSTYHERPVYAPAILPRDWFDAILCPRFQSAVERDPNEFTQFWRYDFTRRLAEDAAAVAFAGLPPGRRADLLAGAEVAA